MAERPAQADVNLFVGRERELAELRRGSDEARAGNGRIILVTGEPGIGKTWLAQELAGYATRSGDQVLWGSCWEGEGAPAYWPWIQIIRAYAREREPGSLREELGWFATDVASIVPEIAAPADVKGRIKAMEPEQARFRLFDAITSFLARAAEHRPLVLILDDLHWADASSLLLLQFLARAGGSRRPLIVGTYRDVEVRPDHPLARALGALAPAGTVLSLGELGAADVARLIEVTAGSDPDSGVASAVYERAGGNPFFVREVVRLLVAQGRLDPSSVAGGLRTMPVSVREVIERRLARQSSSTADVLAMASVIGQEFGVDVLEQIWGGDRMALLESLDEAINARILQPVAARSGRYLFSHALVRETLYEGLPPSRRVALHARIGEALETLPDPEARLSEIAHHFFQGAAGGNAEKAVRYTREAGGRAIAQLAYDEAATLLERAVGLLDAIGAEERERCEVLLSLGDARWRAGELAEMKDVFRRAGDIARRIDAPELLAGAALGYAGASIQGFSIRADEVLIGLLEEGLERLGPHDSSLRVRLLGRLANEVYWAHDERAARYGKEAVEVAGRIADPSVRLVALYSSHLALLGPDTLVERLAAADEILTLAAGVGDREMMYLGHAFRATTLMELDDIHAVDAEIEAAARLAEELRMPLCRWQALVLRTMRVLVDGRLEETERRANEAISILQPGPLEVAAAAWGAQLFVVRWLQGRLSELEAGFKVLAGQYPWIPAYGAVLSLLYCELGRSDEARSQFAHLARYDFGEMPRDAGWLSAMWALALTCASLGDARRAAVLYDLLLPYAERTVTAGYFVSLGSVGSALGVLAATMGRFDDAVAHFTDAAERSSRYGNRPLLALTLREHAAALLERDGPGDRVTANALLGRSLELIIALGLEGLRPRAEALQDRSATAVDAPAAESANRMTLERGRWQILYAGETVTLKDSKGLRDIALLLASPGREIHVTDLITATDGVKAAGPAGLYGAMSSEQLADAGLWAGAPSGAGEILDPRARASYRVRIEELQAAIDEAEAGGDVGTLSRAREELDLISAQLAASYGLGGRARQPGDHVERARKAVTWRIRQALNRIGEVHPKLARHLDRSIRTGTFCAYVPDQPTQWRCERLAAR